MFRDRTFTGNTGTLSWVRGDRTASGRKPRAAHRVTVRGQSGTIVWAGRDAAVLSAWTIAKQEQPQAPPVWMLTARVTRADAFQCRQSGSIFTAVRGQGRWCWPIERLELVGDQIQAVLGQPEQ
jgi:hypothetical protein